MFTCSVVPHENEEKKSWGVCILAPIDFFIATKVSYKALQSEQANKTSEQRDFNNEDITLRPNKCFVLL